MLYLFNLQIIPTFALTHKHLYLRIHPMKVFARLITIIAAIAISSTAANAQLLWRISGHNTAKDSYIIGTHHLAPVSILDSIAGWHEALSNCDAVYGEIDKNELTSQATQQLIMAAAIAPADSTINHLYTPEQIDSIDNFLLNISNGLLSIKYLAHMKPAFINTQASLLLSLNEMPDFNQQQQLDSYIQQSAINMGKSIGAFETAKQQTDILFNYPIAIQADEFMETVRYGDSAAKLSKRITEAYFAQDLDALYTISLEPTLRFDPQSQARLVDNRNKAWVKTIADVIADKSIIVCVGALHLPGDNGLINLLRNQGYTVTPVTKP